VITARQQKNISAAKTYFREHLGQGDYYSEGDKVQGVWIGQGAKLLGLLPGAPVTEEAYSRLCENLHPQTGERLTVRKRVQDRRIFCDFTASAPKSVSIMAITVGDNRIVAAHEEAARLAFQELETLVATRVRKGGSKVKRITGNLVGATFLHTTSRALDPQLHTHGIVFNATHDPVEKRWKAMETQTMFDNMTFLTEVYRGELGHRLMALGYSLRSTENGFEIAGVSEDAIKTFSKRATQIRESIEALERKFGAKMSNNSKAQVAYTDRQRKRRGVDTAEVIRWQRSQLSAEELQALEALKHGRQEKTMTWVVAPQPLIKRLFPGKVPTPPPPPVSAKAAVDYARDHLFERLSVVKERDLLKAALAYSKGTVRLEDLRRELNCRSEFLRKEDDLTTREALAIEKEMIRLVNSGVGRLAPLAPSFKPELDARKAEAVGRILNQTDQVFALDGLAGTGKTMVLQEIARALKGLKRLSVAAPTGAAVEVLKNGGFSGAQTVQSLLMDKKLAEKLEDQLLIVDEAGMLSNKQMLSLLQLARDQHCRLLLVGDHRQHGSVEAGDAYRILKKESELGQVRLRKIQRQQDPEYRAAVKDIALGRIDRGLDRLDRLGAIQLVEPEDRAQRIATDYVASIKSGASTLIVCPTWSEIDQVTAAVRETLKEEGLIVGAEKSVESHRSLHWTLAQKQDLTAYKPGMILNFHTPTRDFRRNEWVEVTAVTQDRIEIRRQNGSSAVVTRKQAKAFDVAKAIPIEIMAGDKILLMESRKGLGLYNGKALTVDHVESDGRIQTREGVTIPADYRRLAHGYAVTSQRSQARTVDRVLVSVPKECQIATNRKQFYVSISRGRRSVAIYTADRNSLAEANARLGQREMAARVTANAAP
jgi:conjugative relaxase-like TrwC/TraI family protein